MGCQVSRRPFKALSICNFWTEWTVTFSSRYVFSFSAFCRTLKRSFYPCPFGNIPSLSLHWSSPSKQEEAWHRSEDIGQHLPTCVLLLLRLAAACAISFAPPRTAAGVEQLGQFAFVSRVQGRQYEMILEEAGPEPAALICRFPEELDLRMWGSR